MNDHVTAQTLDGLFQARVAKSPERMGYRQFDETSGVWRSWSWRRVGEEVARWQQAMLSEGLKPGERVALALRNCVEWVIFEQAALGLGLVVVPLYPDDRADNMAFIIEDAEVRLFLMQSAGHWRRMGEVIGQCPSLKRVVALGDGDGETSPDDGLLRFSESWLPMGKPALHRHDGDGETLATIVYTSGTTGRPKGVMLSHRNILANTRAGADTVALNHDDLFISFLPLAHMLERMAGYYLPMMTGARVVYARSIQQLGPDLLTQHPTLMIAVPRVFETVFSRLQQQLEKSPPWRQRLFHTAVEIGWHRFEYRQGRRQWHPKLLLAPITQRLVGDKVLARLGGRMRIAVSGGAPLSAEVARVFVGLGLTLCQGYGLTESSPVITFNPPEDNDPASIGTPLPGLEVMIGKNDELLVRGPSVMLGYWKRTNATRDVLNDDGWLHTGDQVRREGKHYYITGRIKEILVLSNGEKVPPAELETAITLDPLFEQVMVMGEGRSHLAALVVLNEEVWQETLTEWGGDEDSNPNEKGLRQKLQKRLMLRLKGFPGYAKVRRIHVVPEPWSIENGLMTPTMKLKREKIVEQYRDEIESLFG